MLKTAHNPELKTINLLESIGDSAVAEELKEGMQESEEEDEHDEDELVYSMESDGSYTFDGLTELRDVLEVLPLKVEEDAFETLNGYLISLLEKVPNDGEHDVIECHGYRFEILNVENRIIREVKITKTYDDELKDDEVSLRD